jgi:hypothetical protein
MQCRNIATVLIYICAWGGGSGSSVGTATGYGWTVGGSNPGGGEIFRTCPDQLWGPPGLLYNGYRVFPGGSNQPERGADPSPPSSAEVWKQSSCTFTLAKGLRGL